MSSRIECQEAPVASPEQLSTGTLLAICLTEILALGSLIVPIMLGLQLKVANIETSMSPEGAVSLITAVGAASAMVSSVLFGWWSDRIRVRIGGRAPFIVGGTTAGLLCAPGFLVADSVLQLTVLWVAMQFVYNATFAGLYGLIADHVTEADRTRVSAWFSGSATGSAVVGLGLVTFLPKTTTVAFVLMPTVTVPAAVVAYLLIRKLQTPPAAVAEHDRQRMWHAIVTSRQYWLVWLQRFLFQMSYCALMLFGLFFLIRRVGMEVESGATWVSASTAISSALGVLVAVGIGRLASRDGRYGSWLCSGVAIIGIALLVKAFGASTEAYLIAMLLSGIGIGCYGAVDLALVLRVVPASRAGQFMGLFNIARTLPQSLAPAMAPIFLAWGSGDLVGVDRSQNYFALYLAGAGFAALAMLLIWPIRALNRRDLDGLAPR